MKKAIRQTYWPKKAQRVPIPRQRNDDDRMGYSEDEKFSDWANRTIPFDKEASRIAGEKRAKELTEELNSKRKY